MQPEGSLPCPQGLSNGLYSGPDESSHHHHHHHHHQRRRRRRRPSLRIRSLEMHKDALVLLKISNKY